MLKYFSNLSFSNLLFGNLKVSNFKSNFFSEVANNKIDINFYTWRSFLTTYSPVIYKITVELARLSRICFIY